MEEINLWIVLPLSFLGLVFWVGGFVYFMLSTIKSDPKEIKYRKDSNQTMGILPTRVKEA